MDPTMVNHLFLTQRFLAKGRVPTGGQRLTDYLRSYGRPFIPVEDITLVDLQKGDRIVSACGQVRSQDILLAHEFLDVSGDQHLRGLFEREQHEYRMASIYFGAPSAVELVGRVRREVIEGYVGDDFFVVGAPSLRGLDLESSPDLGLLRKLSYAILNWRQVHCVFQYD